MYEIESIINNDDIPVHSRDLFMLFMTECVEGKLSPRQQRNVDVFRKLYARVDKDMRFFRNFLDLAVNLAEHFKFEQTPLVYAFRNISLEDHFLNFLNFASRQNLIIEKNNPLQLFISLGCSIIKLALKKDQIEKKKKVNDTKRKMLFEKYNDLKRGMSRRFINMDFDMEINDEPHTSDLDNFNCDDGDDYEEEEFTADPYHNKTKIIEKDVKNMDDCIKILKNINERSSSPIVDGGDSNNIFKTLKNGDKELNIQKLDSLVMEAGIKFGPSVVSTITKADVHSFPSQQISSLFNKNNNNVTTIDEIDDEDENTDFLPVVTKTTTTDTFDNDSGIVKDSYIVDDEEEEDNDDDDEDAILNNKPILRFNNHNINNIVDFIDTNK